MLKLCGIKKSFESQEILRGVDLVAKSGELTIITGQNGAGKSTLFNILSGVLAHDEGKIELNGRDISEHLALERSKYLGVLIQDPKLSSVLSLSILENCALALLKNRKPTLNSAGKNVLIQVKLHLEILGLAYFRLQQNLLSLSGGQRQMIAFAMATINQPEVLILDEPTAALDEKSAHLLMQMVKKFVKDWNIPALMISHDKNLNCIYGDKILSLQKGLIYS